MVTWSTVYKIQCVNESGQGDEEGGGEGENYQKGKEMRGQEIKRGRGGRSESYSAHPCFSLS